MKNLLILSALFLSAFAQSGNDVILSGGTYADLVYSQSGTLEDPIVIYGNGSTARCVRLQGNYITLQGVTSDGCPDHGIEITGSHIMYRRHTRAEVRIDFNAGTTFSGAIGNFVNVWLGSYTTAKILREAEL